MGAPRVAVLSNPASRRNAQGALRQVRTLLAGHPQIQHEEATETADLHAAIGRLLDGDPDIVVLNGGDGTVQAGLTALCEHGDPDQLPQVAILAGGRTNMTAADCGSGRRPDLALRDLIAGRAERVQRRLLRVQSNGDAPQYGFFFNVGGLFDAIGECRAFRERLPVPWLRGTFATASWVSGTLGQMLLGRRPIRAVELHPRLDQRGEPGRYFILMATTLERFALGMTPWWSQAPGALRVTAVREPAHRPLRNLPALLRGRPGPLLTEENGYLSCNVEVLELEVGSGFSLDGEDFPVGVHHQLHISAGPELSLLRP